MSTNRGGRPIRLDGDSAGKKMARDLRNGLYQHVKDRIILTDKYAAFENSEVEDLIPPKFLVEVVDRWQRQADTPFADVVKDKQPIVPQVKAWARSQGVELEEGWKVVVSREAKRRALAPSFAGFEPATLDLWASLFNDLLEHEGA